MTRPGRVQPTALLGRSYLDINNAGNHKPLSFAIIISKLFVHYMLSSISPFVLTTYKHFGLIFIFFLLYFLYIFYSIFIINTRF